MVSSCAYCGVRKPRENESARWAHRGPGQIDGIQNGQCDRHVNCAADRFTTIRSGGECDYSYLKIKIVLITYSDRTSIRKFINYDQRYNDRLAEESYVYLLLKI